MSSRLLAATFDAHDAVVLARFWSAMLDRDTVEHQRGVLLPGDSQKLGLRFVTEAAPKTRPNLAHFHLTSHSIADQQRTVSRALDLGAHHLEFGQTPADVHIVLADPGGNELCVIEPDNNYLAGSGFFGELACDGSRRTGLFWSSALNWPLVWNLGEETAIQSPAGGTKVSWGGEPAAAAEIRRRHRFYLVTSDGRDAEADRLVSLGATRPDGRDGRSEHQARDDQDGDTVVLLDPDGNQFELASE